MSKVQYAMENMLPEFKELQDTGKFTPREIKALIKKITQMEYSNSIDYIGYSIKYSQLVEKRLGYIPHNIIKRIHSLYLKFLSKSQSIELWTEYLEWCILQKSTKAFSKAVARAIQLYPTIDRFWIMAAKFEFENGHINSSRILLQRGLRFCDQPELWLQYLKLELLWVDNLVERKKLLGLAGQQKEEKMSKDHDESEDSEDENIIKLPELENEQKFSLLAERTEDLGITEDSEISIAKLREYVVPRAIYRNAILKHPSLEFRVNCLEIFQQFEGSEESKNDVLKSISNDFNDDINALQIICGVDLIGLSTDDKKYPAALEASIQKWQETLDTEPITWESYFDFLIKRKNECNEEDPLVQYLDHYIKLGFEQAASAKVESSYICEIKFEITKNVGELELAVKQYNTENLWLMLLNVTEGKNKAAMWQSALNNCTSKKIEEAYAVYLVASTTTQSPPKDKEIFQDFFMARIDTPFFLDLYLEWAHSVSMKYFREQVDILDKKLLQKHGLFKKSLEVEMLESPRSHNRIRNAFEYLHTIDKENVDLWIDDIKYERYDRKDIQAALRLYWKAEKVCHNRAELQQKYEEMSKKK